MFLYLMTELLLEILGYIFFFTMGFRWYMDRQRSSSEYHFFSLASWRRLLHLFHTTLPPNILHKNIVQHGNIRLSSVYGGLHLGKSIVLVVSRILICPSIFTPSPEAAYYHYHYFPLALSELEV